MNSIERWATLIAALVAVGGLGFTVYQFTETYAMDAKKPFLEEQMELCIELSTFASTIATSEDPSAKSAAEQRFWILYWGPARMIESDVLEDEQICFGKLLNEESSGQCEDNSLKNSSLRLAVACRNLIAENWGISLDDVVGEDMVQQGNEQ